MGEQTPDRRARGQFNPVEIEGPTELSLDHDSDTVVGGLAVQAVRPDHYFDVTAPGRINAVGVHVIQGARLHPRPGNRPDLGVQGATIVIRGQEIHHADELGHELGDRMVEDGLRGGGLFNLAFVHHRNHVANE